ncbi:MAG: hypothetical protein HQL49_11170 [Gammaproteobacteria bacterium]|nr:hypothetical protein [Gammaproteobacteria bacterium]
MPAAIYLRDSNTIASPQENVGFFVQDVQFKKLGARLFGDAIANMQGQQMLFSGMAKSGKRG